MQKTYIFKTLDELTELTVRGSEGFKVMEIMRNNKQTKKISAGQIVTVITTSLETVEELQQAIEDAKGEVSLHGKSREVN